MCVCMYMYECMYHLATGIYKYMYAHTVYAKRSYMYVCKFDWIMYLKTSDLEGKADRYM